MTPRYYLPEVLRCLRGDTGPDLADLLLQARAKADRDAARPLPTGAPNLPLARIVIADVRRELRSLAAESRSVELHAFDLDRVALRVRDAVDLLGFGRHALRWWRAVNG